RPCARGGRGDARVSARVVVPDRAAAAQAATERIAEAVRAGGHVVLTGGSTPRAAYELLAGMGLDWSRVTGWFTDERCVPPDHQHSNYGMARAALLDRIEGPAPVVKRMEGELGPDDGARRYDA